MNLKRAPNSFRLTEVYLLVPLTWLLVMMLITPLTPSGPQIVPVQDNGIGVDPPPIPRLILLPFEHRPTREIDVRLMKRSGLIIEDRTPDNRTAPSFGLFAPR